MEERHKTRIGRVINNRMDKTVVVAVDTPRRFPKYRKTITGATKYKAHDEKNECQIGDVVKIVETRPLSRHKRWRVAEIITRGEVAEIQPQEIT
jgi:small subunit ribosomal protein S17